MLSHGVDLVNQKMVQYFSLLDQYLRKLTIVPISCQLSWLQPDSIRAKFVNGKVKANQRRKYGDCDRSQVVAAKVEQVQGDPDACHYLYPDASAKLQRDIL